eukprot:gene32950-41743_t
MLVDSPQGWSTAVEVSEAAVSDLRWIIRELLQKEQR